MVNLEKWALFRHQYTHPALYEDQHVDPRRCKNKIGHGHHEIRTHIKALLNAPMLHPLHKKNT